MLHKSPGIKGKHASPPLSRRALRFRHRNKIHKSMNAISVPIRECVRRNASVTHDINQLTARQKRRHETQHPF